MRSFSNEKFTDVIKEQATIADCEFVDCVFQNCKFTDCEFENCTFSECQFVRCSVTNMRASEVHMLFVSFTECNLIGIRWADFQSGIVSFPIQKLEKCYLKYNDFEKMRFKKFDFSHSSIIDSFFVNCDLSESNFRDCKLKDTEFSDCDLKKTDFRRASGYKIDATDNRIKGAKFTYPDVLNLLQPFEVIIEK